MPENHDNVELEQEDELAREQIEIIVQANDQPESARIELDESLEEIDVPDEGPVRF